MTTIKVTDKYYISVDKYSYTVNERSIVQSGKNKGNELFHPIHYFGNLKNAIADVRNLYMRDSINDMNISLDEAIKRLETADNTFKTHFLPFIPNV